MVPDVTLRGQGAISSSPEINHLRQATPPKPIASSMPDYLWELQVPFVVYQATQHTQA